MKDSLREKLHALIKEKRYVSYGEVCQFTVEEGYKVETASRRLRGLCAPKSERGIKQTPEIKAITAISKRGTEYISAWEWMEKRYSLSLIAQHQKNMSPEYKQIMDDIASNTFNGIPIFAPKKEKEIKIKEPQNTLGI